MATADIKIRIKNAWWVWPYIRLYGLKCRITGEEPDIEWMVATISRGWTLVIE